MSAASCTGTCFQPLMDSFRTAVPDTYIPAKPYIYFGLCFCHFRTESCVLTHSRSQSLQFAGLSPGYLGLTSFLPFCPLTNKITAVSISQKATRSSPALSDDHKLCQMTTSCVCGQKQPSVSSPYAKETRSAWIQHKHRAGKVPLLAW